MGIDEVDITSPIMKHCPGCGSKDVAIFDVILICHKCHRQFSAYEVREEIGE